MLDQRQVGDFNVQVDVKDVQIIAMMKGDKEEYVVLYSNFMIVRIFLIFTILRLLAKHFCVCECYSLL